MGGYAMETDREAIWASEKGSHYERTIAALEQAIEEAGNLVEALSIALNCVVKAAHAVAGTFWYYDTFGDNRIHPKAIYGGADLGDFSLDPGEGIAGEVIASSRSTIVQDCQSDPRWAGKADRRTGFTTRSMICVPLHYQQHTFGCIQVINKTDGTLFDDLDLMFVEDLASHTAYLFASQHMLDDYSEVVDTEAPEQPGSSPTLRELLMMAHFSDVEDALLALRQVQKLPESDRKHLLHLSREIWDMLEAQRQQDHRRRSFHLFRPN